MRVAVVEGNGWFLVACNLNKVIKEDRHADSTTPPLFGMDEWVVINRGALGDLFFLSIIHSICLQTESKWDYNYYDQSTVQLQGDSLWVNYMAMIPHNQIRPQFLLVAKIFGEFGGRRKREMLA